MTKTQAEKRFEIENCCSLEHFQMYHLNIRKPVELTGRFETAAEASWQGSGPRPSRGPSDSLHVVLNVMEVESGGEPGKVLQKWCFNGYVQHPNYAGKKVRGYINFANRTGVANINLDEGTPQPRR